VLPVSADEDEFFAVGGILDVHNFFVAEVLPDLRFVFI
jgi:hypothetical protein